VDVNRKVRLTEKHRPHRVEEFVCQPKIKAILSTFVKDPYPAAFLFIGSPGVGKTSMAQAIGEQIRADVWLLGSRQCNYDTLVDLCHTCEHIPNGFLYQCRSGGLHLVIIDEVDQITATAQYLLLSKLDSTQTVPNTVFIFTCNSEKGLEARFVSRCIRLDFSTYGLSQEIVEFLEMVWMIEGGTGEKPDWERVVSDRHSNVRDCLQFVEAELLARG
jgi:replication-associated recombination protein RarA